jgi:hypothetical protein
MLKKVISWAIPSLSEFEYIFFVSLFISGIITLAVEYAGPLAGFFMNLPAPAKIIHPLYLIGILTTIVWSAVKLGLNRQKETDHGIRSSYVILPSYVMILLGLFQLGITSAMEEHQASLVQETVYWLVLARSLILIGVIKLQDIFPIITQTLSAEFDDTQADSLGLLIAVGLGIVGGISLGMVSNPVNGFFNAYIIGSVALRIYRQMRQPMQNSKVYTNK